MTSPVVVHVTNTIDWWAIVLDGVASAIVGGVISLFVALLVLRRTQKADRSIDHDRQGRDAAAKLMAVLAECGSGLATRVRSISTDSAEERQRLVSLVNLAVQTEMPSFSDGRYDEMLATTSMAVTDLVTLLYYDLLDDPAASMSGRAPDDWQLAQPEWALAVASVKELADYLKQVSGELAEFRRDPRRQPVVPLPPAYQALRARILRTTPMGWRSEPNGAQAAGAMNALQYRGNHPGYARARSTTDPPYLAFAIWTPCLGLDTDPPTSELQQSFRRFLASENVRVLVDSISSRTVGLDWTSFGGGGRVTFEAALGSVATADLPSATALLAFNSSPFVGADYQHTAALVLRVDREEPEGGTSPPLALGSMVSEVSRLIDVASSLMDYLGDVSAALEN